MSILSELDEHISNGYIFENYVLNPVDFESGVNVSFEVSDGENLLATVKVLKLDTEPVNAVDDTYTFQDVYPDIDIDVEGREDMYDIDNIQTWIMSKLKEMGYGDNPAIVNGEEVSFDDVDYEEVKNDVKDIEGSGEFTIDDLDIEDEE